MKHKNKKHRLTLPAGARRTTNAENKRVWLIDGREYASRLDYFEQLRAAAQAAAKAEA
jgi:hypothetical protein